MSPAELEAVVLEGDLDGLVDLLRAATDQERRAAAPVAVALQKRNGTLRALMSGPLDRGRGDASRLALYGTGSAAQIRSGRFMRVHGRVADVLATRPRALLGDLAPWLVEQAGWKTVRHLVRIEAMDRPTADEYVLGMLSLPDDPRALLRDDPQLLEWEVWRLFELEGTPRQSLADHDKYVPDEQTWAKVLLDLAAADPAHRTRLLDASLAALERDFPAFRAGWFSRFHEALTPTIAERVQRRAGYLRLVGSPIPASVGMAVTALTELQRADALEAAQVLRHIAPAMTARAAATARAALALVERAGSSEPEVAGRAAIVAAEALAHPSVDVQRAALALIERLGVARDPAVAAALERRRADVARSLESRFAALLGGVRPDASPTEGVPAPEGHSAGLPTASPGTSGDAFADLERVVPIATLPELVEAIAHVLETGGPPEDLERVLDGISRLSAERPPGFDRLVQAIRKRAVQVQARRSASSRSRWGAWSDTDVVVNLAALAMAWIDGAAPEVGPDSSASVGRFLVGRMAEVARWAVARTGEPMLSLPSYKGGWIEPAELVERLHARQRMARTEPAGYHLDLVQALLRLLPRRRGEVIASARSLRGEAGDAVRYALGDDVPIGPSVALWVAAARSRDPDGDDVRLELAHPGLGAGAAVAGRFSLAFVQGRFGLAKVSLTAEPPIESPSVDVPSQLLASIAATSYTLPEAEALVAWMRLIWPGSRRSYFAGSAALMLENLEWWEARWPSRLRLEPLFEPWTAIGREAALLLAAALQAKEPGERGLAVDAVVALLEDGRLTTQPLVAAFRELADIAATLPAATYPLKILRPQRLAVSLQQVASRSRAHALAAQEVTAGTIELFVGDRGPARIPSGQLAPLLRLLVELQAETGRPTPAQGRDALELLASGTGEVARTAARLRELSTEPTAPRSRQGAPSGRRWAAGPRSRRRYRPERTEVPIAPSTSETPLSAQALGPPPQTCPQVTPRT